MALEVTAALCSLGAHVVLACKSVETGEIAARAVRESQPTAQVTVLQCDLSSLKLVVDCVDRFKVRGREGPEGSGWLG